MGGRSFRDGQYDGFWGAIIFVLGAALILWLNGARVVWAHDIYHDWKTESGVSCCDDKDCRPVRAQYNEDHWEYWDKGEWQYVPARAVRPITSPDGRSHVCEIGGIVLCFVPGEVRS